MNNNSVDNMWNDYISSCEGNKEDLSYSAWHFCDNREDALHLAGLVKNGSKTATSSLHLLYDKDQDPVPETGDLSIVTDYEGQAQCIIEITEVEILPFNKVEEKFAWLEGEGDRSLAYWKKVHTDFFARELTSYNITFSEDMLVVCEKFKVVYK